MRAVLDANVMFPTILREILCDLARADLYQPLWSERLLGEWRRAAARLGPEQDMVAGAEIALMRIAFPGAMVADGATGSDGLDLPDPADRHVIDTALRGRATLIVTANLRDFPRHAMASVGLRAIHPDAFLCDLHVDHPQAVATAALAARDKAVQLGGDVTLTGMLKRLSLTRLARRLTAGKPLDPGVC